MPGTKRPLRPLLATPLSVARTMPTTIEPMSQIGSRISVKTMPPSSRMARAKPSTE
ncbi:hypothetical protein D3C72_2408140 [compost metagenome]